MLIIIFIFGLIIGSFLNVCIYRIPRHESVAIGRSHCTKCGVQIKWYDLVPVISYLVLLGRCRSCKEKISIIYPLVELINALVYVGIYIVFGSSYFTYGLAVLISIFIVIITIKLKNA